MCWVSVLAEGEGRGSGRHGPASRPTAAVGHGGGRRVPGEHGGSDVVIGLANQRHRGRRLRRQEEASALEREGAVRGFGGERVSGGGQGEAGDQRGGGGAGEE